MSRRDAHLPPRELACLQGAARGLTRQGIAGELGISARTVETYLQMARHRLGAASTAQAIVVAVRRRLMRYEDERSPASASPVPCRLR